MEFPDPAELSQSSATGAVGTLPSGDGAPLNCEWQSRFHDLELEQSRWEENKRARQQQAQFENAEGAARRKAAEVALKKALGEEEVMSPVQSHQRASLLRPAIREARDALESCGGAPPGATGGLTRMIQLADTWLQRWSAQEEHRQSGLDHEERIRRGEASNFEMTQQGLEEQVLAGDLGGVRAGLRAKLSVLRRSDQQRHRTLVHLACDQLGLREVASSHRLSSAYIKIVDALLQAGASANAVDDDGLSPFDLALPGASADVQDALQRLGLRQRHGPRLQLRPTLSADVAPEEHVPVAESSASWMDNMTSGSEWRKEGVFFDGDVTADSHEDPKPGPLAQFLATGALLRSSGGWYKPEASSSSGLN